MANKHLLTKPHNVNENWWWYEEPKGICVVHNGGTQGAFTIEIPWRSIRAALKRKDKQEAS